MGSMPDGIEDGTTAPQNLGTGNRYGNGSNSPFLSHILEGMDIHKSS